jgi:hypothetical protein
MKNTVIPALAIAILAVLFASVFRPDSAGAAYYYNYYFASTLKPWVVGASSPGAGQGGLQLAAEPNGNGYAVVSGSSEGAAWMVASFGGRERRVRVRFDAMNVEGCEHCAPMIYVGNANPTGPEPFQRFDTAVQPVWHTYTVDVPVKSETVVIAIGFEGAGAGKVGIDNLNVKRYYR